jgi:coproporphyrinogen III oxidase-like Fe-S oxidoreductase
MLAERIMTAALRLANKQVLSLELDGTARIPAPRPDTPYMLYVHIPFCERLCPYCSFNRYPMDEERARRYFGQLRTEMRLAAEMGYDFGSVYFGGGTPTVLIDELCDTMDLARDLFDVQEISCETNPNHLIPRIVEPLAERVQRFSVGVQSFDDGLLRQMDRYDKYGSGAETIERLASIEGVFHSLNVDMIFNFPSQTPEILHADIEAVKATGANQVTFYPLMTSPAVRRKLAETIGRVSYEREHDLYEQMVEEISCCFEPASAWTFSRTGGGMIDEYIVDYEEYLGLGSGSFSFLDGSLYVNTFSLVEYERLTEAGRLSASARKRFETRPLMAYRFMMSLFGLELDKKRFREDFGVSVERGLWREYGFMKSVGAFDVDDEERLTLTPKGRYLLVAMMREFFAGVNTFRDAARAALPEAERDLLFGEGDGAAVLNEAS